MYAEIIREFVERIIVSKAERIDGRHIQRITALYFNGRSLIKSW
ncbi:MAG: DUF4368 domain-containing protein [Clostridia bacterium]|nr:DUF4368 domain-containing protein [Clostridia bacterium]MBR5986222.1 DUF4368 domain-containing protein [Clostridia bacterium]MBR6007878.1 DUF4368 domain-containing protein [Clostridia bacterium]